MLSIEEGCASTYVCLEIGDNSSLWGWLKWNVREASDLEPPQEDFSSTLDQVYRVHSERGTRGDNCTYRIQYCVSGWPCELRRTQSGPWSAGTRTGKTRRGVRLSSVGRWFGDGVGHCSSLPNDLLYLIIYLWWLWSVCLRAKQTREDVHQSRPSRQTFEDDCHQQWWWKWWHSNPENQEDKNRNHHNATRRHSTLFLDSYDTWPSTARSWTISS